MEKYDVAIIGGGFCGVLCAKLLERKTRLRIILFDKKDCFEFTPAVPKLVINREHCRKVSIQFSKIFRRTRFVQEEVIKVTKDTIYGRNIEVKAKYIIICSGAQYPISLKNKKDIHTLKYCHEGMAINEQLKSSRNILIIGGGLVGTEIAGELCTQTDKNITIVQAADRLIERNPEKASKYAYNFLTKHNVKIILNERVKEYNNGLFVSDKNKYKTDLGIWCSGIKFKVPYLDKNEFSGCLDKDEHLIVNNYLQVDCYDNVFAGGDVANTLEEKTAQNADRHAKCIIHNILCIENGKRLKKYKPRTGPLVISLGPWNGLFVFKNFVFTGIIPGIMKHIIEMIIMFRIKYF